MLPVFIRRWSLDDGQAGVFSSVLFLAALAGTLASSGIAAWSGYRSALILGYGLMGGGLLGLNASTHLTALEATAAVGIGYGLITPGTNLYVAESAGAKSASLLSLLNFTWGAGAMSCSPMVAVALRHNRLASLLVALGALGALLVLGLLVTPFSMEQHYAAAEAGGDPQAPPGVSVAIALASLFFIYVATENGIGLWAAEFTRRLVTGFTGITTMAPMFFYAGLTFGRISAPLILLRVSERNLVLGGLGLTSIGVTLLTASATLSTALPAIFLAGLGCASIFPVYVAWLSRWYGLRAKRIGGVFFALGSLGGSAGPGLVGYISKLSGSLRVGMLVPFGASIIMFAIVLLQLRKQTTALYP